MATQLKSVEPATDPLDGVSLPGWLYFDREFFEAEKWAFLRAAPQVVCHESEIAQPGEWRTLEYLGESVIWSAATMAKSARSPMSAGTAVRALSTVMAAARKC